MLRCPAVLFTYDLWFAGSLWNLGIQSRTVDILDKQDIIKKHAIGWCRGKDLNVKPRENCVAIMFMYDDSIFWTHLLTKEFEAIFGGVP